MKSLFILLPFFILGCTQVNPDQKAHYEQTKLPNIRHGIIVVDSKDNVSHHYLEKLDPKSIARGKVIYQRDCMSCHGVDGTGKGPMAASQNPRPANLKKMVNEVPSFKFHMAISHWQGEMPGWKNPYSGDELEDLSSYMRTFR